MLQRLTVDLNPERSPGKTQAHAKDVRTHKCAGRWPHGLTPLLRGKCLRMASSHLAQMLWQSVMGMRVIVWIKLMWRNLIINRLSEFDDLIKRNASASPILNSLQRLIHFFCNYCSTVFLNYLSNHAKNTKPSV